MINAKILKTGATSEYQCADCHKIFNLRCNIATHIEAKHIVNPAGITCDLCQTVCATRQGLRKHINKYHR